jgi:two-component system, cell cycle response regulator DivK
MVSVIIDIFKPVPYQRDEAKKMDHLHALIIEDNAKNIWVLATMLSKEGVSHTELNNPNQLEEVLQNLEWVDVVFVDLEMQGRSGYDVLDLLKADNRFQSVPVVAYTVHLSEINKAHEVGFHSFLSKPLDSERFPEQLAKILQGEHVWA